MKKQRMAQWITLAGRLILAAIVPFAYISFRAIRRAVRAFVLR